MLLTEQALKRISVEKPKEVDSNALILEQIGKQNEAIQMIVELVQKTVEQLSDSEEKITKVLDDAVSKIDEVEVVKSVEITSDNDTMQQVLLESLNKIQELLENNNKIVNQLSSFDANISKAISTINNDKIEQQLKDLNENIQNKSKESDKWEFQIVRNVGGFMTSVIAKKV